LPSIHSLPGGAAPVEQPSNPFALPSAVSGAPVSPTSAPLVTKLTAVPTSGLNLLSRVADTWRIGPATTVRNLSLRVDKLTGAQLQQLIKNLPDGITYGLDVEKEDR
jgi:hypothetical protein